MQKYTKLTTYILFMKQYNFQGRYWKPSALSELTVFSELSTATVDTLRKRHTETYYSNKILKAYNNPTPGTPNTAEQKILIQLSPTS